MEFKTVVDGGYFVAQLYLLDNKSKLGINSFYKAFALKLFN